MNVIPFDRPRKCFVCGHRGPLVIVPTVIRTMALCLRCESDTAAERAAALAQYHATATMTPIDEAGGANPHE